MENDKPKKELSMTTRMTQPEIRGGKKKQPTKIPYALLPPFASFHPIHSATEKIQFLRC